MPMRAAASGLTNRLRVSMVSYRHIGGASTFHNALQPWRRSGGRDCDNEAQCSNCPSRETVACRRQIPEFLSVHRQKSRLLTAPDDGVVGGQVDSIYLSTSERGCAPALRRFWWQRLFTSHHVAPFMLSSIMSYQGTALASPGL